MEPASTPAAVYESEFRLRVGHRALHVAQFKVSQTVALSTAEYENLGNLCLQLWPV